MVITGRWQDGSQFLAIPNFARMNRVGPPPDYPKDRNPVRWTTTPVIVSEVWI
jgi:uncharacterized protein